jgi:hypothetical protein
MKPKLVLILFSLALAPAIAAATGGPNVCNESSQTQLSSCHAAAHSTFLLALATCDNVAGPVQQKACKHQAVTSSQSAIQLCGAQLASRHAACQSLGPNPYDPVIDPTNFVTTIDNPYLPLTPGTTLIFQGSTSAGLEEDDFNVTSNTKVIQGVTCLEVHDTVTLNGVLTEDTRDWFAQDKNGNVWYFGENSNQLSAGLVVGVKGSWTGGVDGAKPGIVMEAHRAVSDFYRQEFSPGTAEDVASVTSLTQSVTVPAGSFTNCVETQDTSTLEPGVLELKFYAMGIGNVLETDPTTGEQLQLIQVTKQ